MRPEPYAQEHLVSSRRGADRRVPPATLRGLLRWATMQYRMETPNLAHSVSRLADDGAPEMSGPVRAYLALSGKLGRDGMPIDQRPDDWLDRASHKDEDGFYLTPLRRAIETINDPKRRLFLRDLVPEVLMPSDIATLHGIPEWCQSDVTRKSLEMLWAAYLDRPLPEPGWLSRSDSQRNAEAVA